MEERRGEAPVTIVVAEDDDGHARLIAEHFAEAGRRYLLLLDIRMPGVDGIDVLRRLKADEALRKLPVIMLTTTDDPRDVEACYAAGCSSYLTKPMVFPKFAEVLRRLGLFISIVQVSPLEPLRHP